MPAARPSHSAVANTLSALLAAGLTPAAVHVHSDGSFRVELGASVFEAPEQMARPGETDDRPLSWDDVS